MAPCTAARPAAFWPLLDTAPPPDAVVPPEAPELAA